MIPFFKHMVTLAMIAGILVSPLSSYAVIRDTLAPKTAGFGKKSRIMQYAQAQQYLREFKENLGKRVGAAPSLQERMELVRALYGLASSPDIYAKQFLPPGVEDMFDEAVLDGLFRKMGVFAGTFIKKQFSPGKNLPYLSRVVEQGHEATDALDKYIFSHTFILKYGLDFGEGYYRIVDFAGGMPPAASVRFAQKAKECNPHIKVTHIDEEYPTGIMRIKDQNRVIYFDEMAHISHCFDLDGAIVSSHGIDLGRLSQLYNSLIAMSVRRDEPYITTGNEEFFYVQKEDYEEAYDNLNLVSDESGIPEAGVDMIRVFDQPLFFDERPGVVENELVRFEKMLKEGGVLIAGWTKHRFGQFVVFQKRGGKLVSAEMILTGVDEKQLAEYTRYAVPGIADRLNDVVAKINAVRLLDRMCLPDFLSFYPELVFHYSREKQIPRRPEEKTEIMKGVILRMLLNYSRYGYNVMYDPDNGFMRFLCNAHGDLHPLERVIQKTGPRSVYAHRALLPFITYRAERKGMKLGDYTATLDADQAELSAINAAVNASSDPEAQKISKTWFFRDYGIWGEPLKQYLNALITAKMARGDHAIYVKSIGGSSGKEAYSIGAVIYTLLMRHAEKKYERVQDVGERKARAAAWVKLWDIKIELFDKNLPVFDQAVLGLYPPDMIFPEDKQALADAAEFKECVQSVEGDMKISDSIRDWLIPVYIDLNDTQFLARIIGERKADIIFARNILYYLERGAKEVLVRAIQEGTLQDARYPAFYCVDKDELFGESMRQSWVSVPPEVLDGACRENNNDYGKVAQAFGISRRDVMVARGKMLADRIGVTGGAAEELFIIERELSVERQRIVDAAAHTVDRAEIFRLGMMRLDVDWVLAYIAERRFPRVISQHTVTVMPPAGYDVGRYVKLLGEFKRREFDLDGLANMPIERFFDYMDVSAFLRTWRLVVKDEPVNTIYSLPDEKIREYVDRYFSAIAAIDRAGKERIDVKTLSPVGIFTKLQEIERAKELLEAKWHDNVYFYYLNRRNNRSIAIQDISYLYKMVDAPADTFAEDRDLRTLFEKKSLVHTYKVLSDAEPLLKDALRKQIEKDPVVVRQIVDAIHHQTTDMSSPLMDWLLKLRPVEGEPDMEVVFGQYKNEQPFYQGTPYGMVRALLKKLDLRPDDVFYDLGSGYGRVVFYTALATPAGRVVGVEMVPERVAVCNRVKGELAVRNVEFRSGNVREQGVQDGTVFFMFNPFSAETLELVGGKLREVARGKKIRIVSRGKSNDYFNRQGGWLKPVEALGDIAIFESTIDVENRFVPGQVPAPQGVLPVKAAAGALRVSDDPRIKKVWDRMVKDQVALYMFGDRLMELTDTYGFIADFPREELLKLSTLVNFRVPAKEMRYRYSFLTLNTPYKERGIFKTDDMNFLLHKFLFNMVLIRVMQRMNIDEDRYLRSITGMRYLFENWVFWDHYGRLVKKPAKYPDLFSAVARACHLSNVSDDEKEVMSRMLYEDLFVVMGEMKLGLHDIAGVMYGGTLPAKVRVLPEYERLFEKKFLTHPRRFLQTCETVETEKGPFDQNEPVWTVHEAKFFHNIVLPREHQDKIKKFTLPTGQEVYAKRVNILRVRYPEEEIDIAARVDRALQKENPRYHAQKFIGVVYDKGCFYLLSLGVPIHGTAANNAVPQKDSDAIETVLEKEGVADARDSSRAREILLTKQPGGDHYTVVDFESLPSKEEQMAQLLQGHLELMLTVPPAKKAGPSFNDAVDMTGVYDPAV